MDGCWGELTDSQTAREGGWVSSWSVGVRSSSNQARSAVDFTAPMKRLGRRCAADFVRQYHSCTTTTTNCLPQE